MKGLCLLLFFLKGARNMKNTQSLKLNRDFRRVYKGASHAGGYTVVYARKNRYGFNRLGLTVSKTAARRYFPRS